MQLRDREQAESRRTWEGFSNALASAVEMVVTPLLFALFGAWLDGRFGTSPVLALALGTLGVVGMAVRTYYRYQDAIARQEAGKPWTRARP